MSPPPKYKEETTISPPPKRKDQTGEFVVVAHLHVLPYGGVERIYNILEESFPFEISRDPRTAWHAEIAPAGHPDEGRRVARNGHVVLICLEDGGKAIVARNDSNGTGCFIAGKKQGDLFKIAFGERVTLGAPTGPGTVEIKLTRPSEW